MVSKKFAEKKSCYVLITCEDPNEKGEMHIEMSYEGDIDLASLMVDQAQTYFDEMREVEMPLENL